MGIRRQLLIKTAFSAALSCLAAFILLSSISAGMSSLFVGFDEDFYMKLYYDFHNGRMTAMPESDEIVIFDIGGYESRTEIAEALSALAACKPAAVGMDVFMAENDELKEEADSAIVAALASLDCPLVSPCVYDDIEERWEFPFYAPFVDSTTRFFASPVAFDLLEQYSAIDPRSSKVTFAYKLASVYAGLSGRTTGYSDNFAVNYRNKDFFPVAGIEELDPGFIEGKLVLVGDCKDYRDIRTLPFKIMSSNSMPGVVNHAYTVNSLLSTRKYCRENGYGGLRTRYNAPYHRCGTLVNLLLSYLLCFAFSYCLYLLLFMNAGADQKLKRLLIIVLPLVITVFVEAVLVIACFELFTSLLLLIPDIFLFMTSLLFAGTSNSVVDELAGWKK